MTQGPGNTVALLLDTLYERYTIDAWRESIAAARALGLRIIAFPGGYLKAADAVNFQRNDVYSLVSSDRVGAIVSLSASLANTVGTGNFVDFCGRLHGLPIFHIGIDFPDLVCFRADGFDSTAALVRHLAERHGRRRIACITGPLGITDADDRYQGYLRGMADAGLAVDPDLVYRGTFLGEAGTEAIRVLLDERKKTFDALVCANDVMAVWALGELERRGYSVPSDVSIVGYDDLEISREQAPPLTTIRQPIDELMLIAFTAAGQALRGERVPPGTRVIPTNIAYRRSCGCDPAELMLRDTVSRSESGRERLLLDAFLMTLSFEDARALLLEADSSRESAAGIFLRVSAMVAERGIDGKRRVDALAVLVAAATELRIVGERRVKEEELNLRRIVGELLGFTGAERLGDGLRSVFGMAGLEWWLVSEYAPDRATVRVVASSEESLTGRVYRTEALLPDCDVPDSLIVLPLYLGDESLGFMVVSGIAERTAIIELLREHMSAAILQMRNEERERHYAEELSRLVDERTAELRAAVADLSEARRLLEVQSISDELTGLLNRRGFMAFAERDLRVNGRKRGDVMLAFADLDGLKRVNDTFGHAAGDWFITSFAGILRKAFRDTDVIARLGGDEFSVLASDCPPSEVDAVRRRMDALLRELNASSGKSWKVMASIGFAHSSEMGGDYTLSDLMTLADRRMYEEKLSHRDYRENGKASPTLG